MRGFVLDAGALIALERKSPVMLGVLQQAAANRVELTVPRTVIAQVWRGGPRQAVIARLLGSAMRGSSLEVDELDAARAAQVGLTIGRCGHPDIVDVHVALVAAERRQAVLTSDARDIHRVDPDLVVVAV